MTPLTIYKGIDQKIRFHLADEDGAGITDAEGTLAIYTRNGRTILEPTEFVGEGSPLEGPDYYIDIDGATFNPPEGSNYFLEVIATRPAAGNGRWRREVIIAWDRGDE